MAQDTTPAIIVYQGDGSNTVFSVPFDKGYYGEVKVLFVRRGLADYTYNPNTYTVNGRLYAWANGATYVYTHTPNPAIGAHTYNSSDVQQANDVSAIAGQTITVNSVVYTRAVQHDIANNLLLTWTGTMLEVGDYICIARETERGQPYILPNNQKHIEAALDNIERQVQEVAKKADNALLVDPAWASQSEGGANDSTKMDPINWLKSIIRCMDFSVRGLRYANGWLDYSLDDPNIAASKKSWTHLLNTDNVKRIREVITLDPSTLREIHSIYYVDAKGVERPLSVGSTEGIVNQNKAAGAVPIIYDWVGTEAQYYEQDVAGNHPDWLCYITDDQKNLGSLYITADYDSPNERLVMTSGGTGVGTKITQANYSNTYLRLILS